MQAKIFTLLWVAFFVNCSAQAQIKINEIPDSLTKNANAVIRSEEAVLRIISEKEYSMETTMQISVLNERGKDHALILMNYDRWTKAEIKYAHLYNTHGDKRKSMKKSDIIERSAFTQNKEAMDYSDAKIKAFFFDLNDYPYTVEYKTIETSKNTMSLPAWSPKHKFNESVENASFTIIHPTDYKLRISHPPNMMPTQTNDGDSKVYTWQAKNLKAITKVGLLPPTEELFRVIYSAPTEFDIDGNKGNLSTWQEFCRFLDALNMGRDKLSDPEIKKINEISNQHKTKEEKVAALYKYMQQKTRYVSMQYGMGGYQPYEATYVSNKGYGDCKALSNYMKSILHAAAIPAIYTLVNAGRENDVRVNTEFPQDKFNHVILCVPDANDTIWLECTSQHFPAGYLGGFTANRKALLVSKENGGIVNTQMLGAKENTLVRNITAAIDSLGNYTVVCNNHYRGLLQDEIFYKLNSVTSAEIKNTVEKEMPLKNFTISTIQHKIIKGQIPEVHETILLSTNSPLPSVKKRIFVPIILLPHTNEWYSNLPNEKREIQFAIPYSGAHIDTVQITIPSTYNIEGFPTEKNISTEFGTYDTKYILNEKQPKKILVVQQFLFSQQTFSADKYDGFKKFVDEINSTERGQIVLVKDESLEPSGY